MGEDDYSINTNCIVSDYINYRIQKAGFQWQTSPTRNNPNNKVTTTTRLLCDEFEIRYAKTFSEMCSACGKVELQQESYVGVLKHLIEGELNWGRVAAIFTFSGALAVNCMRKEQSQYVDLIREWTCQFMHSHVETWINNNNGWKGLVYFYENGQSKTDEKKNTWGSLILGGALGAFALGALIVNRA